MPCTFESCLWKGDKTKPKGPPVLVHVIGFVFSSIALKESVLSQPNGVIVLLFPTTLATGLITLTAVEVGYKYVVIMYKH